MYHPPESNPRYGLHQTGGALPGNREMSHRIEPRAYTQLPSHNVKRCPQRVGINRPLPITDITEHHPQQPINRALQTETYTPRYGPKDTSNAPRDLKLLGPRVKYDLTDQPRTSHSPHEKPHPTLRRSSGIPNHRSERRRSRHGDVGQLKLDDLDVDDLAVLKAETKELRKELSIAKRTAKNMGVAHLEPHLTHEKISRYQPTLKPTRKEALHTKLAADKHPTEPWKQALGDLCNGVGCMVLAMCKVVNLTGTTALRTCTQFSNVTDTAYRAAEFNIRERTLHDDRHHREGGRSNSRNHISFKPHKQEHDPYRRPTSNHTRHIRHSHYEDDHDRSRHHESPLWNGGHARGSKNMKDMPPRRILTLSHLSIDSEIDSVSSDKSTYEDIQGSVSTDIHSSCSPSDTGSSFELGESHETHEIGLQYYSRPTTTQSSHDSQEWNNDGFKGPPQGSRNPQETNDIKYNIAGIYHPEHHYDHQRHNFQIDMGELDPNPPVASRVSQTPELYPGMMGQASTPSRYGYAGVNNPSTSAPVTKWANNTVLPATSFIAPIIPTHREIPAQVKTHATPVLPGTTLQTEREGIPSTKGSHMTTADKTVAERIIKHQPTKPSGHETRLVEATIPPNHPNDPGAKVTDSVSSAKNEDPKTDPSVAEVLPKGEAAQRTKRKSFSFGNMWKSLKHDTSKQNVPVL